MTSSRPYLVRAIHEWIVDNSLTPQLIVDAEAEGVQVPTDYVRDGKIELNISSTAVRELLLDNDWVSFSARFAGKPFDIRIPMRTVVAVYAAENGVGMAFQAEEQGDEPPTPDDESPKPTLRVVK